MKNNKGITLIALVIIAAVLILLICAIAGIVIGNMNKKPIQPPPENNIQTNNEPVEQTNEIIPTENPSTTEPFEFTKEFLRNGETSGTVEIIENRFDPELVLSITGAATNDIDGTSFVSGKNRWYVTMDLTKYKTLEFYARKGQDNGDLMVGIDRFIVERIRFPEFPSSWTKYTIDISQYNGEHTIVLAGGYADNTGSAESNTQYCNIKLK